MLLIQRRLRNRTEAPKLPYQRVYPIVFVRDMRHLSQSAEGLQEIAVAKAFAMYRGFDSNVRNSLLMRLCLTLSLLLIFGLAVGVATIRDGPDILRSGCAAPVGQNRAAYTLPAGQAEDRHRVHPQAHYPRVCGDGLANPATRPVAHSRSCGMDATRGHPRGQEQVDAGLHFLFLLHRHHIACCLCRWRCTASTSRWPMASPCNIGGSWFADQGKGFVLTYLLGGCCSCCSFLLCAGRRSIGGSGSGFLL